MVVSLVRSEAVQTLFGSMSGGTRISETARSTLWAWIRMFRTRLLVLFDLHIPRAS